MADNINDDTLEKAIDLQSENISEEKLSANETDIINPIQETENMEVHHHPKVEKKNFKEYFLEFIMIFLAVTMGFIAENIREHFTETKIVHQNLEAFKNDLLQHQSYYKQKTIEFNKVLPLYDSLVAIFYEQKENSELSVVSRLMLQGTLNYIVTINSPTYTQLISSGTLRFVENHDLKASMANYQEKINSFINYNDRIINLINGQNIEIGKIVDYHDFWNKEKIGNFQKYTPDMNPFSLTKEQRNSIIMYFRIYSVQFQAGLAQVDALIKSNESLVKLLDTELEK
jgi:hypothetical protein